MLVKCIEFPKLRKNNCRDTHTPSFTAASLNNFFALCPPLCSKMTMSISCAAPRLPSSLCFRQSETPFRKMFVVSVILTPRLLFFPAVALPPLVLMLQSTLCYRTSKQQQKPPHAE